MFLNAFRYKSLQCKIIFKLRLSTFKCVNKTYFYIESSTFV